MEAGLPDLVIRGFVPADQAAACDLINAGLGEHFGFVEPSLNPDVADIAGNYGAQGHLFLVAENAGILVGTGALILETAQRGRLVRLSVHRDWRYRGLGQRLVMALTTAARLLGLTELVLETTKEWAGVIRFYERCGFIQTGQDQESVYMRRGVGQQVVGQRFSG